ncbi:hypothetical protein AZE42_10458, partial [Rhizopogon vesiculosus]
MFIAIIRSLLAEPPETTGEPVDPPTFWWKIAISVVLVLAGGVFAGLTLGLMGLDELHLRVLATSSEDLTEKRNAQKGGITAYAEKSALGISGTSSFWAMLYVLSPTPTSKAAQHQQVINESLPIFLDGALGGGIAAVVISTTAIGVFFFRLMVSPPDGPSPRSYFWVRSHSAVFD